MSREMQTLVQERADATAEGSMNPMLRWLKERATGGPPGVCSVCSAHPAVLTAAMETLRGTRGLLLVEATANQVDQFGGYTGMTPTAFRAFLMDMADSRGFDRRRIVLGGDHLGPLTWRSRPAGEAMRLAEDLVAAYVAAGFEKLHLDTSMRLADDPPALSTTVIAKRGVRLLAVAEAAWRKRRETVPDAPPPVYVVGSEVPIPGGERESLASVTPTSTESLRETVAAYRQQLRTAGLEAAWERVIAVVVQPGVEFGEDTVHAYDRNAAASLCLAAKEYPFVLEGHSTDYQSTASLHRMVEDGVAILKVGPALTRAYTSALLALEGIERLMTSADDAHMGISSGFSETLDAVLLENPVSWSSHCSGESMPAAVSRLYGLSDRSRYHLGDNRVKAAAERLFANLDERGIPLSLIRHFLPVQFDRVVAGQLSRSASALARDCVAQCLETYLHAVGALPAQT